jgi:hypothetical protein
MTAKIFNCHHVTPQFAASTELFVTLVSGMQDSPDGSYIGDLGGKNIAQKNVFSEYRHQYFVWKNLLHLYDYVGFEHYRRMFFIDAMTPDRLRGILPELLHFRRIFASEQHRSHLDVGPDAYAGHWQMRQSFTNSDTLNAKIYLSYFDVIVQRADSKMTIKEQWDSCMPLSYWNILVEAVKGSQYFRDKTCYIDFGMRSPVWNNMYIMRAEIFDEYMRFFMDCVERMSPQLQDWHRAWGHCGERIFNFFLFQKMIENPLLRVGRLPFILRSPEYVQAQPNQSIG